MFSGGPMELGRAREPTDVDGTVSHIYKNVYDRSQLGASSVLDFV